MPTPMERLEAKKSAQSCRVCAWLNGLSEKDRREWRQAIANPRFGAELVAAEITNDGGEVGETSVRTHRNRGHR